MAENDSEFIGNRLTIFVAVFTPLQLLTVVLRFYARSLTAHRYGVDDWLVMAALLGQFVATGIAIGSLKQAGVGYHIEWIMATNPHLAIMFLKYLLAISSWYYVTISLSKLAICVFYRTLFPQRSVLIILSLTAGIMICTAIASLVSNLAACKPFSANWAPTDVQAEKCIDKEKLYVWSTFPNIITDVILLAIPLPIVWGLQTSKQLKMALTATFVFGSIGLIASILRFVAFSNTNSFIDATFNAVELIIWTVAEPGIYLIAACLMTYRPLLEKFSPKMRLQRSGRWPSKYIKQFSSRAKRGGSSKNTNSEPESHASRVFPADATRSFGSDRGILLSDVPTREDGFEQRPGPEQRQDDGSPANQSQPARIVRTTNIHMSWDNVSTGNGPTEGAR
ncbi:hypothetical protein J7T55_001422 [Diaporthe amygdali]|uniref:uncharacterized protein n=1 Tax=Phomopsis amygdali TaxID=1214568 RepID=UPI0022FE0076|nr:uncharacterized protein J7T55_001422 [Diaporthe amygdali]KAJ0115015.1 hypothetical protein J7T55_001422 [Diaporthe amygdali]